jgi:hypothetical protein
LTSAGSQGAPVTIPSSAIKGLNLTIGGAGKSSIGMLGKPGPLQWPLALRGPQQKKLDKLIPAAVEATKDDTLTPKQLKEIRTEMKSMREDIRKQYQREEIETSSYSLGLDFFHSLEDSINALERPDAKKQLAGSYTPKASNVQELVDYVTENGLSFAPAIPGNEPSYQVVHDACVRYVRTAESSAGFTSLSSQSTKAGGKKK